MNDEQGEKPGGEFDAKTFLYIRTHPADDGSTPLAAGLPGWLSPDITIIRPGGIRGSEGAVGEADQVEVIVTNNGGIDAVDAHVEAFVADPSTAFTPATATLVGSGFLTIPNYHQVAIAFPWTPTQADAGHRCLLARVCLSLPPDCYANPAIFDVRGDRHVAQRNINVVKIEKDTLSFGFLVVNALEKESAFLLRAAEVRVGRNADMVRRALGCPYAQFGQAALGGVGLTLGEQLPPTQEPGLEKDFPTGVLRRRLELPRTKTTRVELRGGERRYVVLTIARNPDIRRGDLNVVQVEQIDIETERTVGGLWLIVQH
jgi:hypothetical protein